MSAKTCGILFALGLANSLFASPAIAAGDSPTTMASQPAAILASAQAALGSLYGSTAKIAWKDGSWRFTEVTTGFETSDSDVTDKDLERISKLGVVETLTLRGKPAFTAGGLAKLADLKGLRRFALPWHSWRLGDDGAKALAQLKELEALDLGYSQISADLSVFKDMPMLRRLKLVDASPTKASIKGVRGILKLEALEELDLELGEEDRAEYNDAFSEGLKGLKALRVLRISPVDGKVLQALKELKHLECLSVIRGVPTDGVFDLSVLPKLSSITIEYMESNDCKIHLPAGLKRLNTGYVMLIDREAMPAHLEHLELDDFSLSDDDVVPDLRSVLEGLPALREFALRPGGDKTLTQIPLMKSLRELTIHSEGCSRVIVTDAGLRQMNKLESLESLTVEYMFSGSSGEVSALLAKLPKLRRLELPPASGETSWLEALPALKQLRVLAIRTVPPESKDYAAWSPKAVGRQLEKLEQLEELSIAGDITDKLLDSIAQLKNLKRLTLWGSDLSDEGLMKLAALKKLQALDLSSTPGYTDKGLSALMQALPDLKEVTRVYRHANR